MQCACKRMLDTPVLRAVFVVTVEERWSRFNWSSVEHTPHARGRSVGGWFKKVLINIGADGGQRSYVPVHCDT